MSSSLLAECFGVTNIPASCYIICATPRSGSSLLCSALANTGLGNPDEFFLFWLWREKMPEKMARLNARSWDHPPEKLIRKAIKVGTRNGIFGMKIMHNYLSFVLEKLRPYVPDKNASDLDILDLFFHPLRFIYITRNNKIEQAVSLARAVQSDEWKHDTWTPVVRAFRKLSAQQKSLTSGRSPVYDFKQINDLYVSIQENDSQWIEFFNKNNIQPLKVNYETFVTSYNKTLREIAVFIDAPLGSTLSIESPDIKRQKDRINEEWVTRFIHDSSREALL